jgi:hypothetical protein
MPRDILLVPVTIVPEMLDTRPYQGAIGENIRSVRYYIQIVGDSWGTPHRNFEQAFETAKQALQDPQFPMKEIVVLFKTQPAGQPLEPKIAHLKSELAAAAGPRAFEFGDPEALERILRGLFSEWLESIAPQVPGEPAHAG